MRILQITSLFSPDRVGGAEIFVEDLARGLADKGHTVAVAAISREQQMPEQRDGFAIHRLGHTTPFFIGDWRQQPEWKRKYYKIAVQLDPRLVRRLARVIDELQPDVVNTHSLSELTPLIWPMIRKRGIPLVHSLHDFTSMCTNGSLFHDGHICDGSSKKCRAFSYLHRRCQCSVDAVAGVGRDIVERHVRAGFFTHVPESRRTVIWNAISPPDAPKPCTARAPGAPVAPLVFGYLGRIEAAKGADLLIEALRFLPSQGWRLVMAGRAPDGIEASFAARAQTKSAFCELAQITSKCFASRLNCQATAITSAAPRASAPKDELRRIDSIFSPADNITGGRPASARSSAVAPPLRKQARQECGPALTRSARKSSAPPFSPVWLTKRADVIAFPLPNAAARGDSALDCGNERPPRNKKSPGGERRKYFQRKPHEIARR